MKRDWFDKFFPIFFGTIFLMMVGSVVLTGWVTIKAVNEIEASGGWGKAIGQFLGEVRKGMEP